MEYIFLAETEKLKYYTSILDHIIKNDSCMTISDNYCTFENLDTSKSFMLSKIPKNTHFQNNNPFKHIIVNRENTSLVESSLMPLSERLQEVPKLFNSPEPKAQVSFSDHNVAVVSRRRRRCKPPPNFFAYEAPLGRFQPNFAQSTTR